MNYESQKKIELRKVIKSYFDDKSSTPYDFYNDLEDELNLATNYHMEQQRKLECARNLFSMNSTLSSDFPYGSVSSDLYGSSDLLSGCISSSPQYLSDTLSFTSRSSLEW